MVDPQDPGTMALPLAFRRGRGRPRKADALSAAERARRYRARKKALAAHAVPASLCLQLTQERDAAMAEVARLRLELMQVLEQLRG